MSEAVKKEKDFSLSIFGLLNEYNKNPNIHLQEEMNKIIKEIKGEARRERDKEINEHIDSLLDEVRLEAVYKLDSLRIFITSSFPDLTVKEINDHFRICENRIKGIDNPFEGLEDAEKSFKEFKKTEQFIEELNKKRIKKNKELKLK